LNINERMSVKNGIMSTMVQSLSNSYFPLFAISVLGATNYQVSLMSSLPAFIGMIAVIPSAVLLNKAEEKKRFTALSIFFTRLFLLFMVFIPFVPNYQAWIFVFMIGLMNFPGTFANISWQSFIGEIIPEKKRATFFSYRNRALTVVGMISTLTIGLMLGQFNKESAFPYQILFFIAFVFGLMEVYYLMLHKEKRTEREKREKTSFSLKIFKDKPYLYFVFCGLFFNFSWQMAWSLFSIYQIKYAHATAFWISLFTVANQIAQILSYKWWGEQSQKHGNKKMLAIAAMGMASAPLMTILSTNLYYLTFTNLITGFFVSGTVTLLFNELLEVTNKDDKTTYIANYNILLSLIAFLAPQFGVFLLECFDMTTAMLVSTFLRFAGGLLFFVSFLLQKKQ